MEKLFKIYKSFPLEFFNKINITNKMNNVNIYIDNNNKSVIENKIKNKTKNKNLVIKKQYYIVMITIQKLKKDKKFGYKRNSK